MRGSETKTGQLKGVEQDEQVHAAREEIQEEESKEEQEGEPQGNTPPGDSTPKQEEIARTNRLHIGRIWGSKMKDEKDLRIHRICPKQALQRNELSIR